MTSDIENYIKKYEEYIANNTFDLSIIPDNLRKKELYESIVLLNYNYLNKIPKEYISDELILKLISKYYHYLNDYIFIVLKDYLTEEIFNKLLSEKPYYIKYIPKILITDKIWQNISKNIDAFTFIPDEYKTKDMCEKASKFINKISYIPKEYLTIEMCKNIIKNNIREVQYIPDNFLNEDLIIELIKEIGHTVVDYIPSKYLSKEVYKEAFKKNPNYFYFKSIPKEYQSDELWFLVIKNKPAAMQYLEKDIPEGLLTKEFLLPIISEVPTCIKYIPKKYITKDLLYAVIDLEPTYLKCIPKTYIDEDLKNHAKLATLKSSSDVITAISDMLNHGGSLESLSKETKIPLARINNTIELLKDGDPDLYNEIKIKLANNQAVWVNIMIEDCNTLSKIISSLGNISNFLTREQKIKFAYLFNKYSHNDLEKIYRFINKYPDKIDNAKIINAFYKKVLKYNYLGNDTTLINERKTIEYNNRWLKKFDKVDYFKIENGIPTIKNQYLEHIITIDIVENIINVLKENNVPLNDMIVKESIRAYYNNCLTDFIEMMQSYDNEIINNNNKKR